MVTEQINSLRQEREASVIGGLLLGGLTPKEGANKSLI